jgi:inorganic triphosphatase YgiF
VAREREIKIRLKGVAVDELVRRIQKLGFTHERTVKQTDIYFDTVDWFLYDQLAALRLRKVNGKDSSFSFKKLKPNFLLIGKK